MLSRYFGTSSKSAWIGEIVRAGVQVGLAAAAETEPARGSRFIFS